MLLEKIDNIAEVQQIIDSCKYDILITAKDNNQDKVETLLKKSFLLKEKQNYQNTLDKKYLYIIEDIQEKLENEGFTNFSYYRVISYQKPQKLLNKEQAFNYLWNKIKSKAFKSFVLNVYNFEALTYSYLAAIINIHREEFNLKVKIY